MGDNRPGSLREDLAAQREYVRPRAPVYSALIELIEAELDGGLEGDLERAWRGREFGAWYERPLILLGALRDDALWEGPTHPLWAAIAADEPDPGALSRDAVRAALLLERERMWTAVAERHLQTNESSRAVAWLWPAALAPHRPLALFDVGASAGLNLVADRLPEMWERAGGEPLAVAPIGRVVARRGFDLRPVNAADDDDARWLRACVWPGQRERLARLDEAIAVFRELQSAPDAPVVVAAGAEEIPEQLPRDDGGALALAYQTIVRDYFPTEVRERYEAGMRAWLAERAPGSALWVELEVCEQAKHGGTPAAITAHVGTGGRTRTLQIATCDPHPRVLTVDDAAVAELCAALRG